MNIWVRDNMIKRLTPKANMDVNQYWMCDYGRLNTYKFVNDESTRLKTPLLRPSEGGLIEDSKYELRECQWDDAFAAVISEMKNYKPEEIAFIASPFSTLEDNFALKRFAEEVAGTNAIAYIPHIEGVDDFLLIRADKTPNTAGLKYLGIKPIDKEFTDKILNKQFKLVYMLNDSISRLPEAEQLSKSIEVGILHISNISEFSRKASVVMPLSTYAEIYGTFVNFQGRVQRLKPAVATLEQERLPGDFAVSRLDKFGAHNDSWTHGTKFNSRPAWKVLTQIAKAMGTDFGYANTEDVFDDIVSKVPAFSGLTYEIIGKHGAMVGQKEEVAA